MNLNYARDHSVAVSVVKCVLHQQLAVSRFAIALRPASLVVGAFLDRSMQDGLDYVAAWNMSMIQTQVRFFSLPAPCIAGLMGSSNMR